MVLFTEISNKKVEVDFQGGEITSDAGLVFLREVEKQIGIIRRLADIIHDNRHPSYVKHKIYTFLRQRVFQIASSNEDGNDCNNLRRDPAFKYCCDKLPVSESDLAS